MSLENIDIRSRRIALGLAQKDVAQAAQVQGSDLRKWERGLELPDSPSTRRLAKVLRVEPRALFEAQTKHSKAATPGEGYATGMAGKGELYPRRLEPIQGSRRVLDLFCGSGGLSFGFEQSGAFVTTCGVDLLQDRVQTFVANHNYATGIAADLRSLTAEDLAHSTGAVDVVVGGPPCQGFSSIRPFRNLTEGDPRNSLPEHYVMAIARLRPRWFVFENVAGILTHQGGERLQAVLEGLEGAGYSVEWRVVNAALYGVPQQRERVIIVGNRMGIPFAWPDPTHSFEYRSMAGPRAQVIRNSPLFTDGLVPAVTLMEAIADLPPVRAGEEAVEYCQEPKTDFQRRMRNGNEHLTLHRATRHSEKMLNIIRHAGSNISALPPGMVSSGFSSCYSRLDPSRPSTTLTVNFVHPASNRCIHPYQDRALTPREGARLQSFPDAFVFKGTTAQIVKQIGNAVPPLVGERIARAIVHSETLHASRQGVGSRAGSIERRSEGHRRAHVAREGPENQRPRSVSRDR